MKHLKLFENSNGDTKLRKTLDDYTVLIKATKKYLTDFCELDNNTGIVSIEDMWYANPERYKNKAVFPEVPFFCINYLTMDDDRITHTLYKKDYEDFLLYLDNPELYNNTKKYNL